MKKIWVIIILFFLSSLSAELLVGNSPPFVFFTPFPFLVWTLLYGCGVLLVRELKTRWNLQWSVIFLAIAYGIIEEGLATKAFFNPNHLPGPMVNYGLFFGHRLCPSLVQ